MADPDAAAASAASQGEATALPVTDPNLPKPGDNPNYPQLVTDTERYLNDLYAEARTITDPYTDRAVALKDFLIPNAIKELAHYQSLAAIQQPSGPGTSDAASLIHAQARVDELDFEKEQAALDRASKAEQQARDDAANSFAAIYKRHDRVAKARSGDGPSLSRFPRGSIPAR